MSNTIPLINRKVVFEYHALGVVIILSYLVTGLRMEAFWEILPVISTAGLCLVTAGAVFRFKRPEWIPTLSFIKNQTQQVIFDSSAYLFTALVVILMEAYLLDHPLIFIGKAVVAILSIGFYTAVGIALEVEYGHIKNYQGGEPKNITQITPVACKWRYLQTTLLTIVLFIFGLASVSYTHLTLPTILRV